MAFLSPLFLIGALAVAIPVVLHLLRRQPDVRVAFSAVHLLQDAPVESRERRRLRELLLLALRVAALLLLALAFARPFFGGDASAAASRATIIALDVSLSMSAPGQFERARARARERLERADGMTAVVLFDATARVASPLSADEAQAARAIDAARPGVGATRYRDALRVAAQVADGRPGRIDLVTDLQASGWQPDDRASIPESLAVEVVDVGAPPANLSVASVRVSGSRVVAVLRNSGPTSRDVRVRLMVNADAANPTAMPSAETTIAVGPGQTGEVMFPAPQGRWLAVSVDDPGGWPADDTRFLVTESTTRPRVLVVTAAGDLARDAFFVEQALLAEGNDGRAYDVDGVAAAALPTWDRPRMDAYAGVVVLSTRGLEHRGRELLANFLEAGGGVLIAAGAEIDGEAVAGLLGGMRMTIAGPPASGRGPAEPPRSLAPSDARHPVLQPFRGRSSLGLVRFSRISAVRAPDCQPLARFTSGEPALIECAVGDGRALVLASDIGKAWNDFPVHATFVPFMHEAMGYLSRARESGEYVAGLVPAGVPDAPGVSVVSRTPGAVPQLAAVNVAVAESDATRLSAEQFQAPISRTPAQPTDPTTVDAREREERQHIWQYVLALMVLAMILESAVAARTA